MLLLRSVVVVVVVVSSWRAGCGRGWGCCSRCGCPHVGVTMGLVVVVGTRGGDQ